MATGKMIASSGVRETLEVAKAQCVAKAKLVLNDFETDTDWSSIWIGRKLVNTKVETDDDDGSPRTTLPGTIGTVHEIHPDRIGVVFENGASLYYTPEEIVTHAQWM
jgi:hypothetical protein